MNAPLKNTTREALNDYPKSVRRKVHPSAFHCLDCQYDTCFGNEYYMLHEEVWLQANPKDAGMLCIGCVEERIGRKLCPGDFIDAPINDLNHRPYPGKRSLRLLSRLTGMRE